MPAPINTNVQKVSKPADKSHPRAHAKKTRVIRRRGRGKDSMDSDDEIEREVGTDSDTDQSSLASDSESESASDDEGHAGIVTPSTTQSPPPLDIGGSSSSVKPAELVNGSAGPFVTSTDWAQLVADENANGAAELPVIDFADMHTQVVPESKPAPPRSRKAQKQEKKASAPPAPPPEPPVEPEPEAEPTEPAAADEPVASTSRAPSHEPDTPRVRGQSARQVYQQRLQADPAFVPRVGEFWGHDDRLLDKDLRSLSGWWRGRWRGRGRGGFSMRGGRGGHPYANGGPASAEQEQGGNGSGAPEQVVSPVDRAWTHDGFEEMKRKDDGRRDEQRRQQDQQSNSPSFGAQRGFRGRGGFFGGRGRGFARGGGVAAGPPGSTRAAPAQDPSSQRVWFAMKPEKVWTKHTDTFLYFEPVLRPRPGQGAGVRVKLPGGTGQVIRNRRHSQATASSSQGPAVSASTTATMASEDGDRQFVVRIPQQHAPKEEASQVDAGPAEAATTMAELSIEEVFTVRPHAVPSHVPISPPLVSESVSTESTVSPSTPSVEDDPFAVHDTQQQPQSEQQSAPEVQQAVTSDEPQAPELPSMPNPEVVAPVPQAPYDSRPPPPVLPPLQTTFSPVPQTSPQYGSPYGYPPALPPGIAMHQGYPYDVATGRPVYLQTPPPMYAPQPMMQGYMGPPSTSMPFVPGHMHHPSQEFVPQNPTPPINGFIDPTTGVPIFAPARQSSRIEIRAPSDRYEGKSGKAAPRPSGLRTSMSGEELPQANGNGNMSQSEQEYQAQMQPQQQPPVPTMDPAMMAYAPYQQQYYYADPNGYPAYMDMSQQMMPYEMYPAPDQRTPQPVIYY